MLGFNFLAKMFASLVSSLVIFALTALWIGEENKAKWFKKRKKYSWFQRRGILGELLHFGYPVTLKGYYVTFVLLILTCISTFLIFTYL